MVLSFLTCSSHSNLWKEHGAEAYACNPPTLGHSGRRITHWSPAWAPWQFRDPVSKSKTHRAGAIIKLKGPGFIPISSHHTPPCAHSEMEVEVEVEAISLLIG